MASERKLEFPDCLLVRLVDERTHAPVSNIAVSLKLYASEKNDYSFLPALSDSSGAVRISRNWVETAIEETRNFFLMDYSSTIKECRPYVDLSILSTERVRAAIEAILFYGETPKMGVEPSASELAQAANHGYEPQVLRVALDTPGEKLRRVEIPLRPRKASP